MSPKSKKRGLNGASDRSDVLSSPVSITPNRQTWSGWCEIESEPAFFNTILTDIGIRSLKVQEVLGLEDDLLAILPKPVYAMIFLFRYKVGDEVVEQETTCPSNIWFANQVPEYACASVALLNIVMNIRDLELGKELEEFKEFTKTLHPVCKGDAIADFEYVRKAHNSFARDVDMLNVDSLLKDKHGKLLKKQKLESANAAKAAKAAEKAAQRAAAETAKAANGTPARLNPPRQARSNKVVEISEPDEDEGFHFIAYMPIDNQVWKLDGMDNLPKSLGQIALGSDWLSIIQTELTGRMLQYQEGQIEFSLMAVIKDPIVDDRMRLAENIKALQEVNRHLDQVSACWRGFANAEADDTTISDLDTEYGISQFDIKSAEIPASMNEKLQTECPQSLMRLRQEIITAQAGYRAAVRDQIQSDQVDADKAMHRRYDYGSFVTGWLGALAEDNVLTTLLEHANKD